MINQLLVKLREAKILNKNNNVNPHLLTHLDKIEVRLLLEEVSRLTSFLKADTSLSARIFILTHNIQKQPNCKICQSPLPFRGPRNGYPTYCSNKCLASDPCRAEKIKHTSNIRYGVHNVGLHPEFAAKRQGTNKERYGCDFPLQNQTIRLKTHNTQKELYGDGFGFQNQSIQEKGHQTINEKYNIKCVANLPEHKQKKEQQLLSEYGVKNQSQKHMVDILHLLQDYDWLYQHYVTKLRTTKDIGQELGVDQTTISNYLRSHNIAHRYIVGFSKVSINWLNQIMEKENIFIQHAMNIGEYKIPGTKYSVDGYCKDTNTIYEFHGDIWHGNLNIFAPTDQCHPFNDLTAQQLYDKTIQRDNEIKGLGYNLVVIWESDFVNGRLQVL